MREAWQKKAIWITDKENAAKILHKYVTEEVDVQVCPLLLLRLPFTLAGQISVVYYSKTQAAAQMKTFPVTIQVGMLQIPLSYLYTDW